MRRITASDLMNPEVVAVREDLTVTELAAFLVEHEISGAPVVDADGHPVGVVSLVDIAAASTDEAGSGPDFYTGGWDEAPDDEAGEVTVDEDEELLVTDIMNPEIHTVAEDASVSEVASTLLAKHVHRLLVMRGDEIVGILSTSDLLGLLIDED
ncbi:MAG: CBS domain-containing protein [Acidobacteria bacterium]|nr:CBS domain-containing protein [Acidobacteriota bacterium]